MPANNQWPGGYRSKTLNFNRIGKFTGEICLAFRLRARTRMDKPVRRAGGSRTDQV